MAKQLLSFCILVCALLAFNTTYAQELLLIESRGKIKPTKIHLGQSLSYKMQGEDVWRTDVLDEVNTEGQLVLLGRNYLEISKIDKLRFERDWVGKAGTSLIVFGASWSFFSAIGYSTDGDPSTNYRSADAILTASTIATGFLFKKIFKYNIIQQGDKHRLKAINLNF